MLEIIGSYYRSSRAYIFEFDLSKSIMVNTYEWCNSGVRSEMENLQALPITAAKTWIERFEKYGEFYITSINKDLDPSNQDYKILSAQGIESLLAAPLLSEHNIVGFLGVDDPAVNTDDLQLSI
jgi:transcriptional regulator with GAF, ATPase, and Fis domain